MRRLIKLKVKLGVYSFVWEELNELTKTWDKFAFVCKDEPRPELKTALKNFSSHVENICELQELDNNIEVLGINLSHIKDSTYITITALRFLHNCKSPMVINTPLKDLDAEDNFAVPIGVNFPTPKGGGFQANKEIRWGWFTQPLPRKTRRFTGLLLL